MAKVCALLILLTYFAPCIFAKDHVQLQNKIHSSIEEENDPMSKVFDLSEYRTVSNKEAPNVEIWKLDNPKITNAGHKSKKNGLSPKSSKLRGIEQTYKQGRKITKNQNLKVLKQKRKENRVENRKKSKPNNNRKVFGKRVKKPKQFKSKDKRKNFKIKGNRQTSQNNASTLRQQERKDKRQQSRLRKSSKKKNRKGKGKNKRRHWRTIEVKKNNKTIKIYIKLMYSTNFQSTILPHMMSTRQKEKPLTKTFYI